MDTLRIGLATQTPLLRMASNRADPLAKQLPSTTTLGQVRSLAARLHLVQGGAARPGPQERVELRSLADVELNPGGVSRLVLQSVEAWRRSGRISEAHWFSLQPGGPPRIWLEDAGVDLHALSLPAAELEAYARTKEKLWADLHGIAAPRFGLEDFRFYARYNGLASDAILAEVPGLDVAYVHDFQLLQVGAIVGLAAPSVLRWHVPFLPDRLPPPTKKFLVRAMEAYDGVIVSTRRDLEGLSNAGYRGRVRQIYPHCAANPHTRATADPSDLEDHLGLPPDAPVVLCVARMDPMKRQDLLLEAAKVLSSKHPNLHVLLIGNGSFSGSARGLGLSKADRWKEHLERLARSLGIASRVAMPGWIPDAMLAAAYERCDVVVLPSNLEGFGLTPMEGWAHGKPCIVSGGCGVAEVVQDGLTGLVTPPGDTQRLAACLDRLLSDRAEAERMGAAGRIALQAFGPERAAAAEVAFLEEAIAGYGGWP